MMTRSRSRKTVRDTLTNDPEAGATDFFFGDDLNNIEFRLDNAIEGLDSIDWHGNVRTRMQGGGGETRSLVTVNYVGCNY